MLKENTLITITQQSEGRNKILSLDFCHKWEFESNIESLTSSGSVVFPKNVVVVNQATKTNFPLYGKNKSNNDLFRRGDKLKIESQYIYWDKNLNVEATKKELIFDGYISEVKAGTPIELKIECNMYKLKQIAMSNQSFAASKSIEDILKEAIAGTGFSVRMTSKTIVNIEKALLTAENETVAQFLAKLKKDYFINSFFRGSELRVGSNVYIEEEARTKIFEFQENIISSDLEYKRKDDVVLSAVAKNHITEAAGVTKDGKVKTKSKRIEVLVTYKNDKIVAKSIGTGESPGKNIEGERRTFTYLDAKTEADLIERATADLKKYYYSGFKGKFVTFGTPHVRFGDNAQLINKMFPDHNGTYKIKSVVYSGGVDGYRQQITIDYKLNI